MIFAPLMLSPFSRDVLSSLVLIPLFLSRSIFLTQEDLLKGKLSVASRILSQLLQSLRSFMHSNLLLFVYKLLKACHLDSESELLALSIVLWFYSDLGLWWKGTELLTIPIGNEILTSLNFSFSPDLAFVLLCWGFEGQRIWVMTYQYRLAAWHFHTISTSIW